MDEEQDPVLIGIYLDGGGVILATVKNYALQYDKETSKVAGFAWEQDPDAAGPMIRFLDPSRIIAVTQG